MGNLLCSNDYILCRIFFSDGKSVDTTLSSIDDLYPVILSCKKGVVIGLGIVWDKYPLTESVKILCDQLGVKTIQIELFESLNEMNNLVKLKPITNAIADYNSMRIKNY